MKTRVIILLLMLVLWVPHAHSASIVVNAFNKGELSPLLRGRTDVRSYYSGCETLENMLVMPYGGVRKRSGSYYIASAKYAELACRLFPFEHSIEQAYVIEAGNEYMRFYKDGGQILDGAGTEDLSSLDNIIAHWLLNDNAANTVVADDDGSTHNGVSSANTEDIRTDGQVGTGCFDLNSQYAVSVTDHADFTFVEGVDGDFSLMAWVSVTEAEVDQLIISKWYERSGREWRLYLDGFRKLEFCLADESLLLDTDLIAHWKLNDSAQTSTVADALGTYNGAMDDGSDDYTSDHSVDGKVGNAFDFDGTDDEVKIDDADVFSFGDTAADSPFSISAWINMDDATNFPILTKFTGSLDEWVFTTDGSDKLVATIHDETGDVYIGRSYDTAITSRQGSWIHVVMTYDATEASSGVNLYLNGSDVDNADYANGAYTAMHNLTEDVYIGKLKSSVAGPWGTIRYADGKIDNVMLFDKELSSAEVTAIYNSGNGIEDLETQYISAISDDALGIGWRFVVATYEGEHASWTGATASNFITLYVDGSSVDSTATNLSTYSKMEDTSALPRIGAQYSASGVIENIYADRVDDVSVFGDVLTTAEVASLYSVATYEISTPYTTSDLFDIQYVQSADVMYLVHPDFAPRSLSRLSHTTWTLAEVDYTEGPFLLENITTTTITPSATTGSITLTASATLFHPDHVGGYWQVSHYISAVEIAGSVTADANSASLTVYKGQSYDFETDNTWVGKTTLQRSYDAGTTWFDVIPFTSSTDENVTHSDVEDLDDAIYRVNYDDTSGTMEYSVMAHSFKREGIVEITAYTNSTTATATVTKTLGSTAATEYWNEAAWSDKEGYPSCIAFVEERQAYANTIGSPQTIWLSETDNWDSFLEGAESSDAISRTIAANQVNAIRWLSPQSVLMFGTTGGEWKLHASGIDEPLTPDNTNVKRQTDYGSADIQAQVMNNSTIFVQRNDKIVRKLQYSYDVDMWVSPNLTILAEHITGDSITQIALQKTPYPILWCVREDGELIGLTMEESQEVLGWHHHNFGGDVKSVAVIHGANEDEVWVVIERTVDNNIVRYVEQLQPINWGSDQKDMFFVDSGLSFDGGDAVTISGVTQADPAVVTATSHGLADGSQIRITGISGMTELNDNVYTVGTVVGVNTFQLRDASDAMNIDSTGFAGFALGGEATWIENHFTTLSHLNTEDVVAFGDGGYDGAYTVNASTITLGDYYNTVHIGLAYTAKLKPMALSMPSDPGALFGVNQRITEVLLRLHETLDCEIGADWTTMDPYYFREWDNPLEAATPLYTGDKLLSFPGSYARQGDICIQSAKPLPLTVLGLRAEFESYP